MKKFILILSLVTFIGSSLVSCSTDDSALENDTKADSLGLTMPIDNGDVAKPKPPMRP